MSKNSRPNGHGDPRNPSPPKVSRLGQRLRELSDRALATGTKTLTTEQINKQISEARGRSD